MPTPVRAQDTPEIPEPPPSPAEVTPSSPSTLEDVDEAADSTASEDVTAESEEVSTATGSEPEFATTEAPPAPELVASPADASDVRLQTRALTSAGAPRTRLAVNPAGATGLLRVTAADAVRTGLLRVGFGIDFFSVGSFFESGDDHTRVGAILSLSATPLDFLETWLNVRATSNTNDSTDPSLLQTQGDVAFGLKGFYPVADIFTVGADAQLTFLSGIGGSTFDLSATEVRLRALSTADFTKMSSPLPLRAHLNLGYVFDNSDNLRDNGQTLTQPERFALGINEYSRILVGVGIEAPFEYVTPYLEYTAEFPVSPQYLATPGVIAVGNGLSVGQTEPPDVAVDTARPAYPRIVPQVITPGIRVTAIPKLTLDLAVEIGITPDEALGVPSVPPYNIVFFASYPLDPFGVEDSGVSGPPISVPIVIPDRAAAGKGTLVGTVLDQSTDQPISGAIIRFDRAPPVATADSGRFRSLAMEPGPVIVTISKDGYRETSNTIEIGANQEPEVQVALERDERQATIRGRVIDARDQPLSDATVRLQGPVTSSVATDADGRFEAEAPAGEYSVVVEKDGYLSKAKSFALKSDETISADVLLRQRPTENLIQVKGDRILLQGKVHFVTGEARLEPDAETLLDNVVDLLVRTPELRVRIEGHTDNVGRESVNQALSLQRAEAVKAYLTENGVDDDRLATEGFGSSRPLAPNLTRRGREQNRRVEFHLEQ